MESQRYKRDDWDRVLLVAYMHHLSLKLIVDKIGKSLVADTGHAIADHLDGHARGEVQTEEYTVEERDRSAEGVTDASD